MIYRRTWLFLLLLTPNTVIAHPLENRTFDRGIQVVVHPQRLAAEYRLGLSELTIATELLNLAEPGTVPATRIGAIELYGKTLFPLLCRGLIFLVDGVEANPTPAKFTYTIEDHVQYVFLIQVELTQRDGDRALEIIDTNFAGERGYRRIALRAVNEVTVVTSTAHTDLDEIPLTPTWEMTPKQEEASTRLKAMFRSNIEPNNLRAAAISDKPVASEDGNSQADDAKGITTQAVDSDRKGRDLRDFLSTNRDTQRGWKTWVMILAGAFLFGVVHAVKPGHGKTMVAAYLVGEQGTVYHATLLGVTTTLTHTGSVLFVALMLKSFSGAPWASQDSLRFWLTFLSGILMAGMGGMLLARRLVGREDLLHVHGAGGHVHLPDGGIRWLDGTDGANHGPARSEHHHEHSHDQLGCSSGSNFDSRHERRHASIRIGNLLALGFSGGLVPCDDAVLLLIWSIGVGMLSEAVYVLLAFSAGLASVLVFLGVLVVKVKSRATHGSHAGRWARMLQVASATLIVLLGLALCWQAFENPVNKAIT